MNSGHLLPTEAWRHCGGEGMMGHNTPTPHREEGYRYLGPWPLPLLASELERPALGR